MVPIIEESLHEFPNVTIGYSVGDLDNGVQLAIEEERNGADIIISRGGTAQSIKKKVTIPVIDMHLSGYDLLRSLTLASNIQDKTAVVGFSNITSGAASIIDVLDLPMNVYTVNDSNEVAPLLLELKEFGYQQILGDVITVNTSFKYGLKGMLLQSGKESIVQAIESAIFISNQLTKQNKATQALTYFISKEHPNLFILDEANNLIAEDYTDFLSNPLTDADLSFLNTHVALHSPVHHYLHTKDGRLAVTGYQYKAQNQIYRLYTLSKEETSKNEAEGLTYHHQIVPESLVENSDTMTMLVERLTSLYEQYDPIFLVGKKGTGKKFIAKQTHASLGEGLFVTVDGTLFHKNKRNELIHPSIGTILFTNAENLLLDPSFPTFLQACKDEQIRIIITSETGIELNRLEELKMNRLTMPSLAERKADIHELALFFLSEYHQQYGTKAVKLSDEVLQSLQNHTYKNEITSLKTLMKQLALEEIDYIIHHHTMDKVFLNHEAERPLPLQGTLQEIESEIIKRVLSEEGNNQTKAAKRLGINRSTLWRKLKG